ncbi:MAG: tRNA (adenosine(37)-N6)-threonylcarbamoyltransferase complex dimerization subunit type 1 TsaB [Candidatus Puniceispirillales bacterium]
MGSERDDILIGFESSGGKASVAISRGRALLARHEKVARHGHATWMLTLARDALAEAGLQPEDCTAVVAGRGPGSFTGIRVALAAAKGLGLALGVPAYGLPSLEAMAHAAGDGVHPVAALGDSRRGSVFVDCRDPDGQPMAAVQDLAPEAVASVLAEAGSSWIITGHIAAVPGLEALSPHALIADDPDAGHLCGLFDKLAGANPADWPLDPLYLSAPLLGPARA